MLRNESRLPADDLREGHAVHVAAGRAEPAVRLRRAGPDFHDQQDFAQIAWHERASAGPHPVGPSREHGEGHRLRDGGRVLEVGEHTLRVAVVAAATHCHAEAELARVHELVEAARPVRGGCEREVHLEALAGRARVHRVPAWLEVGVSRRHLTCPIPVEEGATRLVARRRALRCLDGLLACVGLDLLERELLGFGLRGLGAPAAHESHPARDGKGEDRNRACPFHDASIS